MPDIFNYDYKQHTAGQLASSEFAVITLGTKQSLVQSFTANYNQDIATVTQLGDSQIYWVPGRPTGSISISKLVGNGGFFAEFKEAGHNCGLVESLSLSNKGGSRCNLKAGGALGFTNGIIESLSLSLGTPALTMTESAQLRVTGMTV